MKLSKHFDLCRRPFRDPVRSDAVRRFPISLPAGYRGWICFNFGIYLLFVIYYLEFPVYPDYG